MRFRIALLLTTAVLSGCATGSHIITGTARPAISTSTVKLYGAPPERYEIVGTVNAYYGNGVGQGATDACVSELRKQAARIGANGILLGSFATQSGNSNYIYTPSGPVSTSDGSGTSLTATAIHVPHPIH
jgi:hypothetical protein